MILQLIRLLLLPAPSSAVASPLSSAPPAAFTRFGLPADLDCGRMLAADPPALSAYSAQRLRLDDRQPLAIDCASIRARHLLPAQPMSAGEAEFPLAFSRTVYKDYHFLEAELAATFAPQNWYCFALDAKADPLFRARMHALAKCLPNVLLTTKELAMDSQGHNQSASHFECMKELAQPGRAWRYLLLLQNSDVQLKSNEELVQIFRWFNGSSDVEICAPERLDPGKDWSFAGLRLFRSSAASPRGQLPLAKGYLESTLSRQFVDFLVHKLDLTRLLAQIDGGRCFVDEHFLQMLLTSDELNAPGRFTQACLERGYSTPYVTKLVAWFANSSRCHSKFARHHACIFGMEDLGPLFSSAHSLVANKMSMDFDWGAIRCWHELMHNRTYLNRGTHRLKAQVYLELPQVRYHKARMNGKSRPEESGFDCRYKIDKEDAVKMYDGRQDQQIKKRTDAEIRAKAEREARGQCHTAEENGRRR